MIVTRFAPSPTGYLHIGGLRTALYNYLWAKKNNGKFLLRIEDTDLKRNSQEAAIAIKEAFLWCGLSHDEDIYYQSQRMQIYQEYIDKLLKEKKAYKCYMSKEELDELRAEQIKNKQRPRYDGRYRDFDAAAPKGINPVIRIKAPLDGNICFHDGIKGDLSFSAKDNFDDFIIARSDGSPTYNFCVAIDDALMGVTDVIRGDDHLSNTPKQIIIYEALNFKLPKFYHVPMINNEQGKKLSKRDGALDVMEYKKEGFLKEALLNFLVRLGWGYKDKEIFSLNEMIELFNPSDINKSSSNYNTKKLTWLNSHYINEANDEYLFELINENKAYKKTLEVLNFIKLLKQRAKSIHDFSEFLDKFIQKPTKYDEKAKEKFLNQNGLMLLKEFCDKILNLEVFKAKILEDIAKEILIKHDAKLPQLAQPIRISLLGDTNSPSIFEILEILGKNESITRIQNCLKGDNMAVSNKVTKEESLQYHLNGKLSIEVTKPCVSAKDLSMAYTPGVAHPCLEIQKDNELAYKYTAKGNLVAVVTDSTAVLGLGDIGAVAGKPVMEGKAVLFKKFANVDAFDIELDEKDPDKIVEICKAIAPTFGAINLEDIAAPKCFHIEQRLIKELEIPVMHDDQHGTAIITSAGLINALDITKKDVSKMKIVVSGAGAAGIACANMYKKLGAKHIVMLDSKGVIYEGREGLNDFKKSFAIKTDDRTLSDAMRGADMFLGLSAPGIVTKDMVKNMNANPIIFALANPTPEILPEEVMKTRDDVMMGTGRSDYPNQVNNVLAFPFIFRGALDVRARKITENMKMAAANALAMLARENVSDYVRSAYSGLDIKYGKDYIIPKPFDKRVLVWVTSEVAKAAINDGVARVEHFDLIDYKRNLALKAEL